MSRAGRIGLATAAAIIAGVVLVAWLRGREPADTDLPAETARTRPGPTRAPPAFRPAGEPAAAAAGLVAAPDGEGPVAGSEGAAGALVDQLMALLDGNRNLSADDRRTIATLQAQLLRLGAAAAPALIARIDAATTSASGREVLFHSLTQLPGKAAAERIAAMALAAKQPALRTMAIENLGQRRSDEAVRTLATVALNDPDLPARPLIAAPRDPADPSTQLPDERSFTPRMQAMVALAATKDPKARDVLLDILITGPDESLRMEAARSLGGLHEDPRVTAGLQRAAASDPSPYVRLAALHALAATTDVSWLPDLTRIAAEDRDAGVRVLAQQLLEKLRQN